MIFTILGIFLVVLIVNFSLIFICCQFYAGEIYLLILTVIIETLTLCKLIL